MIDISVLDKNLAVEASLAPEIKAQFDFYDIDQAPFAIYGVFREGDHYVRFPDAIAKTVSEMWHT